MLRVLSVVATLLSFWLLLSGIYTPFLIAAGLGSAIAVTMFCRRMGLIDSEGHPSHLAWSAALTYWPWLLKEIAWSAWDVTRRVLHPGLPISPVLVEFRPSQKTDLGLVIHANSITLTPGTIAIEVGHGRFLVHALTGSGAEALAGSEMDRRCTALEGR